MTNVERIHEFMAMQKVRNDISGKLEVMREELPVLKEVPPVGARVWSFSRKWGTVKSLIWPFRGKPNAVVSFDYQPDIPEVVPFYELVDAQ